jgi:hypothetical protein
MRTLPFLALMTAASLAACDFTPEAEAATPPVAKPAAAAEPATVELIPGTPSGDLEQWVAEMRTSLETIKREAATDLPSAHRRTLDLYVTRQEYLEMYYGPGQRMAAPAELGAAVKLNEDYFHALMGLTGAQPPSSAASVQAAVADIEKQLDVVLAAAKHATNRLRPAANKS